MPRSYQEILKECSLSTVFPFTVFPFTVFPFTGSLCRCNPPQTTSCRYETCPVLPYYPLLRRFAFHSPQPSPQSSWWLHSTTPPPFRSHSLVCFLLPVWTFWRISGRRTRSALWSKGFWRMWRHLLFVFGDLIVPFGRLFGFGWFCLGFLSRLWTMRRFYLINPSFLDLSYQAWPAPSWSPPAVPAPSLTRQEQHLSASFTTLPNPWPPSSWGSSRLSEPLSPHPGLLS